MQSKFKIQNVVYVVIELTSVIFASIGAVFVSRIFGWDSADLTIGYTDILAIGLEFTFTVVSSLIIVTDQSDIIEKGRLRILAERTLCSLVLVVNLAVFSILLNSQLGNERGLLVAIPCLYFVISLCESLIARSAVRRFGRTKMANITAIITTSDCAARVVGGMFTDWIRKYELVIINDPKTDSSLQVGDRVSTIPVAYVGSDFDEWILQNAVDEIMVDLPYELEAKLMPAFERIQEMGTVIHMSSSALDNLVEGTGMRIDGCKIMNGHPMVTFRLSKQNPWALIVKRAFDILVSIIGLVISLPIIAIVAIPLLIESPGPLFFKQKRVGKNGREFCLYKIRSMYTDAEERKAELLAQNEMSGHMFKMKNDPRITKVGKFIRMTSIDELPQFWNILKGDMSLVGTRPPTVAECESYSAHHKRRLNMKPGLTGMWQVSGRSDITDFEEVVKLDVYYIDNWSLRLDIKIIIKTVFVVLARIGSA